MQTAKIHFEMLKGRLGLISPGHVLNARRLTAVKVSAAYTAIATTARNHNHPYEKPVQQEEGLKSDRS